MSGPSIRLLLPYHPTISAPKVIIYDNACALHNYCLNRDPEFFKDTTFLVDRFHWKNHTSKYRIVNIDFYVSFRKGEMN